MGGATLMSEIRAHACAKSTTASCTVFHRQQIPLQTNRRMLARATWDRQRLIPPCALAQNCGLACVAQTHHLVHSYTSLLVLGVTADSKYANASATPRRPSPCAMGFRVGLRRSCKIRSKNDDVLQSCFRGDSRSPCLRRCGRSL